jgi:hypothetical protein
VMLYTASGAGRKKCFTRPNAVHDVSFPEDIITVQYTSCF